MYSVRIVILLACIALAPADDLAVDHTTNSMDMLADKFVSRGLQVLPFRDANFDSTTLEKVSPSQASSVAHLRPTSSALHYHTPIAHFPLSGALSTVGTSIAHFPLSGAFSTFPSGHSQFTILHALPIQAVAVEEKIEKKVAVKKKKKPIANSDESKAKPSGKIHIKDWMRKKKEDLPSGNGLVTFGGENARESVEEAVAAVNGMQIGLSTLSVVVDPKNQMSVKVSGLPPEVTAQGLTDAFRLYGEIASAGLESPKKKAPKVRRSSEVSYGFVRFEGKNSTKAAKKSLEMNGTMLGDKAIRVSLDPKNKQPRTTVRIRNLPPEIKVNTVKDAFRTYGTIAAAGVEHGWAAGGGVVRFAGKDGIKAAKESLALHGSKLGGKTIQVMRDPNCRDGNSIALRGLPPGLEEKQLKEIFTQFGKVAFAAMAKTGLVGDGKLGKDWPAGTGVVRFGGAKAAKAVDKALEMDGSKMRECILNVILDQKSRKKDSVRVSGLPDETDGQELADAFRVCGKIAFAAVSKQKGKSRSASPANAGAELFNRPFTFFRIPGAILLSLSLSGLTFAMLCFHSSILTVRKEALLAADNRC